MIDLRSDTVTKPTPAMREAMAHAEVGDDVYGDDPTIARLETEAAARMGKAAGLFVASGTMGNAVALLTHTVAGDEVLMDGDAHSMLYEVGMPAAVAHVQTRNFRSIGGVPVVDEIASGFHTASLHNPGTTLLVLENTHNRAGGAIIPLDVMRQLRTVAIENGVAVHLDGARLFNAAVATDTPAADFAACADTVTFCLSKGLGCPVGSVLCGSAEWIGRARRFRKRLGGGMRQAGILAAAGLYALEHHVARLADDHRNAQRLAAGLEALPGYRLASPVATNMVYLETERPAAEVVAAVHTRGVNCLPTGANTLRLVTHLDISAADIETAIAAFKQNQP